MAREDSQHYQIRSNGNMGALGRRDATLRLTSTDNRANLVQIEMLT